MSNHNSSVYMRLDNALRQFGEGNREVMLFAALQKDVTRLRYWDAQRAAERLEYTLKQLTNDEIHTFPEFVAKDKSCLDSEGMIDQVIDHWRRHRDKEHNNNVMNEIVDLFY